MKPAFAVTLIACLAFFSGACGPAQAASAARGAPGQAATSPREVTVAATEMAFSPTKIEIPAGQPIKLTLKNNGVSEHTWQVQLGADTVVVTAQPHQSASTTFTAPTPGTYKFI